jgi:hypothetical protein
VQKIRRLFHPSFQVILRLPSIVKGVVLTVVPLKEPKLHFWQTLTNAFATSIGVASA